MVARADDGVQWLRGILVGDEDLLEIFDAFVGKQT